VSELRRVLLAGITGRGFDTDAVALAVTEAITNVVRHAYSAPGGTVMLSAQASTDELVVAVTDEGIGSRSDVARRNPGMGVGLALIRELSKSVHIDATTTGTTITMRFTKLKSPRLRRG
jgi:anti-sigma regulatory factor (Ser/Thr protein kinase)